MNLKTPLLAFVSNLSLHISNKQQREIFMKCVRKIIHSVSERVCKRSKALKGKAACWGLFLKLSVAARNKEELHVFVMQRVRRTRLRTDGKWTMVGFEELYQKKNTHMEKKIPYK